MTQPTHTVPETTTHNAAVDDYAIWQALKPYIGHCLSLNHDINNPLAGILGYTEFMLEDTEPLTAAQRKHLTLINTCAERIKKLVEALCEEKMAVSTQMDLRSVTDAYKEIATKL